MARCHRRRSRKSARYITVRLSDVEDEIERPVSAWAVLGVGARGKSFRGCRYELPFGWVGWIRWRDATWPEQHFRR